MIEISEQEEMASPNAKHFLSLCLHHIDSFSLAKAIPIAKASVSMGRTPQRHGYQHRHNHGHLLKTTLDLELYSIEYHVLIINNL